MKQEDIELLQLIHKNAALGRDSLDKVIPKAADGGLADILKEQRADINRVCISCEALLGSAGEEAKSAVIPTLMANTMGSISAALDPSSENIARMVVSGNRKGVRELDEKLRAYPNADPRVRNLGLTFRRELADNIRELAKYA